MVIAIDLLPYEPDDAAALTEAVQESVREVQPWMPWCYPGYSIDDAREYIDITLAARRQGMMYDFAIMVDGRTAGGCGINQINSLDRVANLGYWVRTSCTGRGIASAAVTRLLCWAFDHTNLNRIEIVAAIDNHASQRVAEKVGANRDAVLAKRTMVNGKPSDAVLFSVLRAD